MSRKVTKAHAAIPVISIFIISFLFITAEFASGSEKNSYQENEKVKQCSSNIAVPFVNEYLKMNFKNEEEEVNWIKKNKILTERFKAEFIRINKTARMSDPELGLDMDPILDAQDFPDKGMKVKEILNDGYFTLQGNDWKEFEVTGRISIENGSCRIDGMGMINIPETKRSKRF